MTVEMKAINDAATSISDASDHIMDTLTVINNVLNGMPVSLPWTGPSASAANDAANEWSSMMTALYGTEGDPSSGILNVLSGGLTEAAQNYASNDYAITYMFNVFWNSINGNPQSYTTDSSGNLIPNNPPATSPPPDNAQDVTDNANPSDPYHSTAVNETF